MIPGIDVSRYERVTSWDAVKAAGYIWMSTRATIGDYYIDPTFKSTAYLPDGSPYGHYWPGAKAAGLKRSAYHVPAPWRPKEQINKFIDLLLDDPGELPPALDLERFGLLSGYDEIWWRQNKALTTECVRHAVIELQARFKGTWKWFPIIYTTQSFYAEFMLRNAVIEACPLWVANYTTKPYPAMPIGWSAWQLWQYSESGTVPGIIEKTDLNWAQDDFIGTVPPPPVMTIEERVVRLEKMHNL